MHSLLLFYRISLAVCVFLLDELPLLQLAIMAICSLLLLVFFLRKRPSQCYLFPHILNTLSLLLFFCLCAFLVMLPLSVSAYEIIGRLLLTILLGANAVSLSFIFILIVKACHEGTKRGSVRNSNAKFNEREVLPPTSHLKYIHTT